MKTKYKIARTLWAGLFPLYIMEELNLIPDEFEFIDIDEYDETLDLLAAGKIDANFNSLADALLIYSKGVKVKLIMPSDITVGKDGLISGFCYNELIHLKGKKIGVSLLTYSHVLLNQIFSKLGYSEDDFILVNVRGENVLNAIKSGDISAGHTWGVHIQEAISQHCHLIFTSEEFPGLLVDSLVVRNDSLEGDQENWKKFINAHELAVSFWENNQEFSKEIICKKTGLMKSDVNSLLSGVHFIKNNEYDTFFDPSGIKPPNLYAAGKLLNDFFKNKGLFDTDIDLEQILCPL
jgi:NitT/TauT family transport system substrate-binding protein